MSPDGTATTPEALERSTAATQAGAEAAPGPVVELRGTATLVELGPAARDFERFKEELFGLVERKVPDAIAGQSMRPNRLGVMILGRREQDASYSDLVAHYSALWPLLERPESQRYSSQARLGIEFLKNGRLREAACIVNDVEFQISTPKALSYVMQGVRKFIIYTLFFLVFSMYGIVFGSKAFDLGSELLVIIPESNSKIVFVLISSIFGMFGSVVSILLRIAEFESTRGRSKIFLELTGATLPLVGGAFGAVIAALLAANVVNISFGTEPGGNSGNIWLYVVIGFLSGFSERFSRSFLNMAEGRLGAAAERPNEANAPGNSQPGHVVANARLDVTGNSRLP